MLSAGVGLWSLGTLIAPPAAKMSLLALCASRVFVGLGEGLAPSSATGIMAKIVPECVSTADATQCFERVQQPACVQALRAMTDGFMLFTAVPTRTEVLATPQARARTCSYSGVWQFRRRRCTGAGHLRAADPDGGLAGCILPVCGAGSRLVYTVAARAAGAGRLGCHRAPSGLCLRIQR